MVTVDASDRFVSHHRHRRSWWYCHDGQSVACLPIRFTYVAIASEKASFSGDRRFWSTALIRCCHSSATLWLGEVGEDRRSMRRNLRYNLVMYYMIKPAFHLDRLHCRRYVAGRVGHAEQFTEQFDQQCRIPSHQQRHLILDIGRAAGHQRA